MTENERNPSANDEPALLRRLREHFGCDPATLAVIEQNFAPYERANVHFALAELLADPQRSAELYGIIAHEAYADVGLARLSRPASSKQFDEGPVEYTDQLMPDDGRLACVTNGLYLIRDAGNPLAVLLFDSPQPWQSKLVFQVMAPEREAAENFSRRMGRSVQNGKAFRGHVLSLERDCQGGIVLYFHHLPSIQRHELILPIALLERIERHTLTFNRHADKLRAAGRHLKRGLLFYGPPGTGKTLTAKYLVTQMPGRTVLLLTGGGMGSIESACKLARMLAPSTVILEDVDLVGTERNRQAVDANALLFELLNQMDGLADDTDIVFLLTTNRPDILEPALAARPGRIDQAIEIPLPDADCRRRLLTLFGKGLNLVVENWDAVVARTAGVSGAFIRELLRKAAVFAAEESETPDGLRVSDRHLDAALTELLVAGGPLTQSLLGAVKQP